MRKVLNKKRRRILPVLLFVWMMSVQAFGQQVTVSGTITDPAGDLLPGVTVVVQGTNNGTVSDNNGKYSLTVPGDNVKLSFSYIGFESIDIETNGQRTINVTMQESVSLLDEVVVVGYGTMVRRDVTSSITTVNAAQLNVGVYTNPGQLLQGKVPGLLVTQSSDPNASTSLTLRGASSIRGGAAMEPYYIIDGMPGVSLSLIAPDDIESVDVLRDATATAIYGSKAANGVIIVTTKKGKSGQTGINYSGYMAADQVLKNYDVMNAAQLRSYAETGNITLPNDLGADTRWQDVVQRTGFSHNHNISISGSSENSSYNASANYMENQGMLKGTDMDRLIGRAFVQSKGFNNRLTLSFSINASVTNRNEVIMDSDGKSVPHAMYYYSPLSPVRNQDGSFYQYTGTSQNHNPLALIEENINATESKTIEGTGKASLEIIDGLVYNLSMAYQTTQDIYSKYNYINSSLTIGDNGRAQRASVTSKRNVLETYLNYNKTFNLVHTLGLMAGYSWEESNDNDAFQVTTYDYYNDDLTYHNMAMANKIDQNGLGSRALSTLRMISFYGRVNYSYASKYLFQGTVRRDGSSAFGKNNRWATFPSASLAWRLSEEEFIKNLDIFDDLKLRMGYGVSGNSLGFDVFTATQLYGATNWYDRLTSSGVSEQVHILSAIRNANPDLKWERTGMFNIGLDFGFFNNRLNGSIEFYDKRTKDLIYDYAVSTARYQFDKLTANVGEISNRGVELSINALPVKTRDFSWETSINLSHNKNKVVALSNALYTVDYIGTANIGASGLSGEVSETQRIMEGYPIGQFFTFDYAGVKDGVSNFYVYSETSLTEVYKNEGGYEGKVTQQADGRYKDNATGEYVTTTVLLNGDRIALGSAQPKLTAGWNNTLAFQKWTLTAFVQGVFGNKIMNGTRANLSNLGWVSSGKNVLADVLDDNPITDYNSHMPSSRYLEDGSYVRLSTLTLGYNFGKIGNYVKGLRLYVSGNNLITVTGYRGLDPEVNMGGIEPGIDNRHTYPHARTFMVGINVNL
ncbi:MAG: TonB-dependent receptor [Tannerella sp.]|nr:TonB-dependent receptor [Tannerella sp.]